MQKYTPLKGVGANNAPPAPPLSIKLNGYKTDIMDSETETVGNNNSAMLCTTAASSKHYNNKTNKAKLEWWNAPAAQLTFYQTIPFDQGESLPLKAQTQESDEKVHQHQHQQHNHQHQHQHQHQLHHQTYNEHACSEGGNSPISKSASSSCYKLHHLSSSNNENITNRIPLTNQFSIEEDPDHNKQDSRFLLNDKKPCFGLINPDEDDELKISGYRRSKLRSFLCWLCICLTGGLLRLILHWWRHWYLIATHEICTLEEAEKVLVEEVYKGKHKIYYVEPIQTLNFNTLRQEELKRTKQLKKVNNEDCVNSCNSMDSLFNIDEKNFHLSMHFQTGQFKYCSSARIFNCKQLRYAWNSQTQMFEKLQGLDVNVLCAYFHQQKGLTTHEQMARRLIYGQNEITIPYKNIMALLFLEVLNPFYVFQIFSVMLWFMYDYHYYACAIILMSVFGITMSIIQTKKNQDDLMKSVLNTGTALIVNEKGDVKELPTQCLVPGDIIEIPSVGCTLQCDAVLLSGNCILDESMLTGESVPVTKTPLPMKRGIIFDKKEHARHTLFCGTKVIQTRLVASEKVLAVVINTGNVTAKGGLIRSILYPPPVDYKFEQDSYKFIQFLAIIALFGFIYTLVSKILRNVRAVKIMVESLDIITIVVPPALPAAMTVGRFYAQKRLEGNNIYCISPRSVNVAGSIDCCCFDKTGTLTEDGLDMWGVVPKSATNQFQIPIKQIDRLPAEHFLFCMVTCHSITILNGKMMGDPLDLKMFESTGWILEDPQNQDEGLLHSTVVRQPKKNCQIEEVEQVESKLNAITERQSSVDDLLSDVGLLNGEAVNDHGVVREFPFTSNLQRMSVITKRLCDKNFNVYCKGSPEMLHQLCLPSSLPDNFSQQLAIYAKQGYRVIALAYKKLSPKVNFTKVQRLARETAECDLDFLGFVVLENRLKPDTTDVIGALLKAEIRTIMVTGDNILTALSVARDCGIVSSTQPVVTVNVRQKSLPSDVVLENSHGHSNLHGYGHGHGHGRDHEHNYELYYTLDLGSASCASTATANGKTNGTLINSNTNDNLSYEGDNNYHRLNGDVASLSSAASLTMPNSKSCGSVQTIDTWTNNDIELGISPSGNNVHVLQGKKWRDNYRFAMEGKTWQVVKDYYPDLMKNFLTRGVIYARMSPEQKQALIMELQNIDYCVAMCGDGANDCGALKAAHTGISLSESESSIASPFTSRNPTIAAVPNIIKEGRAALVTSFGIFKYMAAYSMVQFISVMILYSIESNLSDKQFLYIDLCLISVFAFFFGKTKSFHGPLAKQVPLSSLISLTPLVSIVLHLLVVIAFQVCGWYHLHQQAWFVPYANSGDEDMLGCWENYTIFAISCFQYIILAFVFSKGAPYRRPIWSNLPFCLTLITNLCIVIYLILIPPDWLAEFFQLILPQMTFRYWMLFYGICNFIAHVIIETLVVEYLLFTKFQARRDRDLRTSKRKYMQVEYDLKFYQHWPDITEEPVHTVEIEHNEANPAYYEISAEQNFDTPVSNDNPLNNFFDFESNAATSPEQHSGEQTTPQVLSSPTKEVISTATTGKSTFKNINIIEC